MRRLPKRAAILLTLFITLCTLAWAIPGYHISDDASAQRAVHQYADNCFQFRAAAYQAALDKNLWRLALAAHQNALQKPGDPRRECSFAIAYWQSQEFGTKEDVPPASLKQLRDLYNEAVRDIKDAVQKMPDSVEAHLTYGHYLQYFTLMDKSNIPLMLHEYKTAVALRPDLGETHYALARGYLGSGDYSKDTADKAIAEAKKAIALDPRLSESYFTLATAYALPSENNIKLSKFYLDKYLTLHPEYRTRKDVAGFEKYFKEKLSGS